MERKQHFEHYNSKFTWEAILRASMVGLSIGSALIFIAALVTWLVDFSGLWIMLGAFAAGFAISMPIFYFKMFRPTVESNARRIDRYGLEERLITMVEFEGDDSCMARLQRQDAAVKLAEVKAQDIRIRIPKLILILTIVAVVLGGGMTTVNLLAEAGILPSGQDFLDTIIPEPDPVYIEVTYMVYEGGTIEGDEAQVIVLGGETTPVIAVPDDGYAFDGWDDGGRRPTRSDSGVTESIVYTAIFLPLGENGQGEGDGDAAGEGDMPGDQPGDGDGEGEGQGNNPMGPPSGGAGGEYRPANQVIDGETYVGEVYDQYYDNAIAGMTENMEMSQDSKDFILKYYNVIQTSDTSKNDGE